MPFTHRLDISYYQVDQQGVVFNMWYLGYLDDAMTAFLLHGWLRYADMLAAGYDVQLVHTELDWSGPLRWGDEAAIDVALGRLGRTSFTLQFTVRANDQPVATAETVYVVVATDGSGKTAVPALIADAIGPVAPLR